MSTIFYAETTATLTTNSATLVDLPGLAVTIPAWVLRPQNAIVTVNIPNPCASGEDFPGAFFQVAVNGTLQNAVGAFTYNEAKPASNGRIPMTLVTKIALPVANQAATIQVKWAGLRGSTVHIDSPTSLLVQVF